MGPGRGRGGGCRLRTCRARGPSRPNGDIDDAHIRPEGQSRRMSLGTILVMEIRQWEPRGNTEEAEETEVPL